MTDTKKSYLSKKVAPLAGGLLVVAAIASVLIPLSMSNGLEKFNGDERIFAERALTTYIERSTSGIEKVGSIGIFKYRIEKVETASADESPCNSKYRAYISERSLFGLYSEPKVYFNC